MRPFLYIFQILLKAALLLFSAALLLFTLFSSLCWDRAGGYGLLGYHFFSVQTNSMAPTFEAGDVVIVGSIDPQLLTEGDVISFYSPDPNQSGTVITHQIDQVTQSGGQISFLTKGVASARDLYPVSCQQVIGVYRCRIPKAGFLFQALKSPVGYLLLVLLPFFLLLFLQTFRFLRMLSQYRRQTVGALRQKQLQLDRALQEACCSRDYNRYLTGQLERLLERARFGEGDGEP